MDEKKPFAARRLGTIMAPDPTRSEESAGAINPAVARAPDGGLYLLPRLIAARNVSRIGLARVLFDGHDLPRGVERRAIVLAPREPYECGPDGHSGGCEDPRVTFVSPLACYVMAYVALGAHGARVALAVSDDLLVWRHLGPVHFDSWPDGGADLDLDLDGYLNKGGALFPEVVRGPDERPSLALLHRPMYHDGKRPRGVADPRQSIWISYCALDDARRDLAALTRPRHHHELIAPRYPWEDLWIGGGAPPVLTPHGWLVIYHGVQGRPARSAQDRKPVVYHAGVLILDRDDPRRVLYRLPWPLLSPDPATEIDPRGTAVDAVFPTGIDARALAAGHLTLYYGISDTRIGAAVVAIPDTLPPPDA